MKKSPICFLCATVFSLFSFFAFYAQVAANVGIGPIVTTYTARNGAAPGAVLKGEVFVTNERDEMQFIRFSVADVFYDENNIPNSIEGDIPPNKLSLRSWIKLNLPEDPLPLKPKGKATVPYEIHIPNDATPGAHVGAIYALGIPDPRLKNSEALTVQSKMAAVVLVEIPGDIVKSGEITSFHIGVGSSKKDSRFPSLKYPQSFFSWPPVYFEAAYKNTGNSFYQPSMQLEVRNILGKIVGNFVATNMRIFPGNTLYFSDEITKGGWLWFGPYKAILHSQDGDGKTLPDNIVTFWIVPWHLILLAIVLIGLFLWLKKIYAKKRIKKLKKHIEQSIKKITHESQQK